MDNIYDSSDKNPELSVIELNYLYNLGVTNFKTKNYPRALAIFQLLMVCNRSNILYCKALAGCYQATKNYFMAIITYNHCLTIDASDINYDCHFYSGICFFELQNYSAAKDSFIKFKVAAKKEDMPELCKKADLYLLAINKLLQNAAKTG